MLKLFDAQFSSKAVFLVLLFTVVEIVTLVVWLVLAPKNPIGAVVVLGVGLLIEHFISAATGVDVSRRGP
jgi:hypothetical protein